MCARFTLKLTPAELQEFFDLFRVDDFVPRYNIALTQRVPAIRLDEAGHRVAHNLFWPFVPPWATDPKKVGYDTYNARGEEAATKTTYKKSFRRKRCIIPASGYYEWKEITPKDKQPYYFTLRSGEPLAMAGLWETWTDKTTGESLDSCAIVTAEANELIAEIHAKQRMPVLIPREAWDIWLDPQLQEPEIPQSMIVNTPSELWQRWPVGKAVGSPKNESPDLIEPIEIVPIQTQRGLF